MEDKVIHEMRVIETETGYRIEINGDKERIKRSPLLKIATMRRGRRHGRRRGMRGMMKGRMHRHHRGPGAEQQPA